MNALQARIAIRHAMKDQIRKLKDVLRRISDEGAVDPLPLEKIRVRLIADKNDILDLQARVVTLEGKMVTVKAALLDHEARIAALEGGP